MHEKELVELEKSRPISEGCKKPRTWGLSFVRCHIAIQGLLYTSCMLINEAHLTSLSSSWTHFMQQTGWCWSGQGDVCLKVKADERCIIIYVQNQYNRHIIQWQMYSYCSGRLLRSLVNVIVKRLTCDVLSLSRKGEQGTDPLSSHSAAPQHACLANTIKTVDTTILKWLKLMACTFLDIKITRWF